MKLLNMQGDNRILSRLNRISEEGCEFPQF
jgi:hypothetical protein